MLRLSQALSPINDLAAIDDIHVDVCRRKTWIFGFLCNIAKVYWLCEIVRSE